MADPTQQQLGARALRAAWFVLSAGAVALVVRFAWGSPVWAGVGLGVVALLLAARWLARRRATRVLQSGDVRSVLSRWSQRLERVPHAATMAPLMAATAFAAYGWVARAREVLRAAERGPAWEAALEHRLFLDTILRTFEGDLDGALAQAERLGRLPVPDAGALLVERVRMLRAATAALARAFAHRGAEGDRQLLLAASDTSPLVHWAMRYGAAILAIDQGDLGGAGELLEGAPSWPDESRFRGFHAELVSEVARRRGEGSASASVARASEVTPAPPPEVPGPHARDAADAGPVGAPAEPASTRDPASPRDDLGDS